MAPDRNTGHTEEDKLDVLKSTQTVIHKALEKLGYPEEVYELLKEPMRLLTVKIPVRMDDGSVKFSQVIVRKTMTLSVRRKAGYVFTRT